MPANKPRNQAAGIVQYLQSAVSAPPPKANAPTETHSPSNASTASPMDSAPASPHSRDNEAAAGDSDIELTERDTSDDDETELMNEPASSSPSSATPMDEDFDTARGSKRRQRDARRRQGKAARAARAAAAEEIAVSGSDDGGAQPSKRTRAATTPPARAAADRPASAASTLSSSPTPQRSSTAREQQTPRATETEASSSAGQGPAQPIATLSASAPALADDPAPQQQQSAAQQTAVAASTAQQQPQESSRSPPQRTHAAVSAAFAASCGALTDSPTSLVVELAVPAAQAATNARPAWASLPRPSANNSRSVTAVAQMLNKLDISAPVTPRVYVHCASATELEAKVQKRATERAEPAPDTSGLGGEEQAGVERLARYLADSKRDLPTWAGDRAKVSSWPELLTPYTGTLGRALPKDATAEERQAFRARCILRLDFPSTLACAHAFTHLQMLAKDANKAEAATRTTGAIILVRQYRRRLITARVTGFAIGAITPGADRQYSRPGELHGNWQLLRAYLQRAAPHCHPSQRQIILPNGKGAVDFVLEQEHRAELEALNGIVDPEHGITRPLRLTVSALHRPTTIACSTCGKEGHQANSCSVQLPAGQRTCRTCYATGHTAAQCTVQEADSTCKLCNQTGHVSHRCSLYRPRWVAVQKQGGHNARSTFAAEHIRSLQHREAQTPAASQQQRPGMTEADFPPLVGGGSSHTAQRRPPAQQQQQQQRQQQQQPPQQKAWQKNDSVERQMEKMAQQMVEMQRYMDAQMKLVAEQREQERRAAEQRDAERKEAERQREREHERAMERLRQEMHAAQQQTTMAIAVMQASIQQLTTQIAQLLGVGGLAAPLQHKPTSWEATPSQHTPYIAPVIAAIGSVQAANVPAPATTEPEVQAPAPSVSLPAQTRMADVITNGINVMAGGTQTNTVRQGEASAAGHRRRVAVNGEQVNHHQPDSHPPQYDHSERALASRPSHEQ